MSSISKLWQKLRNKAYRDGYTEAQLSIEIPFQIRALRKARDWTQAQLAERCGIPQARISHIEQPGRDPLSLRTLYRLASAFDVGLLVQFVSFSELVRREASFHPETFRVASYEDDHLGKTVHTTQSLEKYFRVYTAEEGHSEPFFKAVLQTQMQQSGRKEPAWALSLAKTPHNIVDLYSAYSSNPREELPTTLTTLIREEKLWPQNESRRTSLRV